MLPQKAIEVVASAVFERPVAQVLEAYSELDQEPRQFLSAETLVRYIRQKLAAPRGSAFFFVVYLDMSGRADKKVIHLNQERVLGHRLRYTWEGWGLISIHLEQGDHPLHQSHVAANSEKRALKWASTYPEWPPPSTWNWQAVASHTNRLQRVLKKLSNTTM